MNRLSRKLVIASASLLIAFGAPAVAPLPAFAGPTDAVVPNESTPAPGEGDTEKKPDAAIVPSDETGGVTGKDTNVPAAGVTVDNSEPSNEGEDGKTDGLTDEDKANGDDKANGEDKADGEDKANGEDELANEESAPADGFGDDGTVADVPHVTVTYGAHVQHIGWQDTVTDGKLAGTTGRAYRMEALTVKVSGVADLGVEYKAHVQKEGWQDWVSDGEVAGTTGLRRRVEAIRLCLTGTASDQYTIWYRVHAQKVGWMGWAHDGELAGTAGMAYRLEALQICVLPVGSQAPAADGQNEQMSFLGDLSVSAHVQKVGWQKAVSDAKVAGTTGRGLRLEAFKISVAGESTTDGAVTGSLSYRAYVQGKGWQNWVGDGNYAGTVGEARALEALQIKLSGDIASNYDLYYRVHVSKTGWMGWAENGAYAGTSGTGARIEAVQLRLVRAGDAAPSDAGNNTHSAYLGSPTITYSTYVQDRGWQKDSSNGAASGVTGAALRAEAMRISIASGEGPSGGVQYRVLGQDGTWQDWLSDGAEAGAPDSGQYLQAMQVTLTGDLARDYDVYYCTHVQKGGWLGWTRDGRTSGSVDQGLRIEAIKVCLRVKGQAAPGQTLEPVYTKLTAAQQRVINAAKSVPSPGGSLCAMWVSQVFNRAGQSYVHGDADDMYYSYCTSTNEAEIKPGMVVAVSKHNHTRMGAIYGHIGIYIGHGQIMDNVGTIRTVSFHDWTSYYGQVVSPKWGWFNHIALA